jgi:SAM-dependent methyltransferase
MKQRSNPETQELEWLEAAFRSPEFWKKYAQSVARSQGSSRVLEGPCWDRAAETYDDLDTCQDYRDQVDTVIATLLRRGALGPARSVLDVACGTGTYALRMAPHCQEVVCIDISRGMLEELAKKRSSLGLSNIETVHSDWQTWNTERSFHLVFVSMTPLLRSMENLDRMLELSTRFLAVVSWAGVRENALYNSLFRELMGAEPARSRRDILLPFHYLYARGFAPDILFFHGCWQRTRPVDRQTATLLWQLEMHRPLAPHEQEHVHRRVSSLARNGLVTVKTRTRTALMLIDQNADHFPC